MSVPRPSCGPHTAPVAHSTESSVPADEKSRTAREVRRRAEKGLGGADGTGASCVRSSEVFKSSPSGKSELSRSAPPPRPPSPRPHPLAPSLSYLLGLRCFACNTGNLPTSCYDSHPLPRSPASNRPPRLPPDCDSTLAPCKALRQVDRRLASVLQWTSVRRACLRPCSGCVRGLSVGGTHVQFLAELSSLPPRPCFRRILASAAMAHLAALPTPADDLPLFARGSPPAQLRTLLFLDSNAPFPTMSSVTVDADLLVRAMEARYLPSRVINGAKDFCDPTIGAWWHRWMPQMWGYVHTTLRRLTSWVVSSRGVSEISQGFQAALTRLEVHYAFPNPSRVNEVSAAAKDAFLQQLHYIEIWLPGEPLPSHDRLLVNAELGGRYLRLLSHFRAAVMLHLPHVVNQSMSELQTAIPFTFFASLPLDLIDSLVKQAARPRGPDEVPHPESVFRYAVLDVYDLRLESVIALYELDVTRREKLQKWRHEYLEHHAKRPTWSSAETPHDARMRSWHLSAVQSYWERHCGAFLEDWERLENVRIELIEGYCKTKMLPAIDSVPQHSSNLHSLSRISLRAARRYGTTPQAWAAQQAARAF
ncbi:uncharacterized protein RHTO_01575 [Rhodotorula toruloides NP11]|uniref:Uncharacterized protein n=1 Tax=Rhodotorula toruloides (strain NP11) TaxID=1130832 RepID=M7WUE9_RHOT1|nr:uncharacterized protein RHTO_01575 [Rhodotorula toruloides NP11]EMS21515.1 hypothetical protein RHTO_01575 [Rhodotorula toruloides NP11]